MTERRRHDGSYAFGVSIAFGAGLAFGVLLMAIAGDPRFTRAGAPDAPAAGPVDAAPVDTAPSSDFSLLPPALRLSGPPRDRPGEAPPRLESVPSSTLAARGLIVPVEGVAREALQPSFTDPRGAGRTHEAIDILAPRHTPVLAVEDGSIARLFFSDAGGITVYQFDPATEYVYYYAHLERYADGLTEGDRVRRGQVLGYVGTSGNAPPGTPHLHFAIFKLTDDKRWWEGAAIDPYPILRRAPNGSN